MAEDVEQHMTELTWLVDELQDEIEALDTTSYTQVHRRLALNLTDAIIQQAFMLRRAVIATSGRTNRLSEQERAQLLGV